jgi:hypothetical protein
LSSDEEKQFVFDIVEEARKEAGSIDVPAFRKADIFLSLTLLYTKIQPIEASSVFREAVKAINVADDENPNNLPEKDYAPFKDYISLPFELLEMDEINISNSFSDLGSRRSRVRLKLGLLESSLKKYSIEKKKVEFENKKQGK